MTCVETMKLDLIYDFLQLLPEINGVWTNFWNSFFSVITIIVGVLDQ